MDPLVSTHILLGADQKRQLRFWAADRDTSMATLVREAVDLYLRVTVGPSPRQVRLAARSAVGALPFDVGPSTSGPEGGPSTHGPEGGPSTHGPEGEPSAHGHASGPSSWYGGGDADD